MATKSKVARGTKNSGNSPARHGGAQQKRGTSKAPHGTAHTEPSLGKAMFQSMKRVGLFDAPPGKSPDFSRIEWLVWELGSGLGAVKTSIIKSLNGDGERHILSALALLQRLDEEVQKVHQPIFEARGNRNRARMAVQS